VPTVVSKPSLVIFGQYSLVSEREKRELAKTYGRDMIKS
jgi:hypothetical protein